MIHIVHPLPHSRRRPHCNLKSPPSRFFTLSHTLRSGAASSSLSRLL
jgi:hypothetical protein